jgi:hypothetical protein
MLIRCLSRPRAARRHFRRLPHLRAGRGAGNEFASLIAIALRVEMTNILFGLSVSK